MELVTTIYDLVPGVYTVEVYNWDGSTFYGGGEIEVPGMKGVTFSSIPPFDYAQSGCLPEY